MAELTTTQVWEEIDKQLFAVLGMVTARDEARTVGIVYIVHDHKLYMGARKKDWKTRHIAQNPHVSLTIPIAKRIPLLPWIKIPAATITFSGEAEILDVPSVSNEIVAKLYRGMEVTPEIRETTVIIAVTPEKEFITYGVGIPLMAMQDTEKARGRVAVM